MPALLGAFDFPAGFERVGPGAAGGEGHTDAVERAVDAICVPRGKAETGRVDLIKVTEYLDLQLVG